MFSNFYSWHKIYKRKDKQNALSFWYMNKKAYTQLLNTYAFLLFVNQRILENPCYRLGWSLGCSRWHRISCHSHIPCPASLLGAYSSIFISMRQNIFILIKTGKMFTFSWFLWMSIPNYQVGEGCRNLSCISHWSETQIINVTLCLVSEMKGFEGD